MTQAPLEIKKLAVRLYKSGSHTQAEISNIVGYSVSAIKYWIAKDKQGLPLSSPTRGHQSRKLDDNDRQLIRQVMARQPDITIEGVRQALNNKASKSAVHREMVELGFTFKKKRNTPTSKKGQMCNWRGWNGLTGWKLVSLNALFLLMKPLRKPI